MVSGNCTGYEARAEWTFPTALQEAADARPAARKHNMGEIRSNRGGTCFQIPEFPTRLAKADSAFGKGEIAFRNPNFGFTKAISALRKPPQGSRTANLHS